ncbi:MAG: cobalamin-independent methionine synthase II family protein [Hyphomicrobiaceae bacterium]|nr:cobalamin-independent methionine synthase II family protein [Hyphomicrobiaceae bacterium]
MPLLTTTIGSYPKPAGVHVPNWFDVRRSHAPGEWHPTKAYDNYLKSGGGSDEVALDNGTVEVVHEQVAADIDVPTDGEIRREHYIYYQCRHLSGFDFAGLTHKAMRQGSWVAEVPTVRGPIKIASPILPRDWRIAQSATDRPVKITLPGPMTIIDSTADAYYGDERRLAVDLADALNAEVRALAEAGCRWIQIDEPVFAREPDRALTYGIDLLARCFHGVPATAKRAVHICCGYPSALDLETFPKANASAYFQLSAALEAAPVDAISIEDAHRHNDLSLLERFRTKTVMLGLIGIARTRIEPVEEIRARLEAALGHIDAYRLIAAPDCGLIMLDRKTVIAKLRNLAAAARMCG